MSQLLIKPFVPMDDYESMENYEEGNALEHCTKEVVKSFLDNESYKPFGTLLVRMKGQLGILLVRMKGQLGILLVRMKE